ncbi:MAG TPA: cation diffusion facilitator family transporter [Bacteroidales bacterium]|nr:cation diffusion facilitator family transporter [Bacteroidales bacterium]
MNQETKKRKKHNHKHHRINDRNLLIATLLNFVITIAEIAGGIMANSLALLSDALHNLSDTFSTFIAYIAALIGKRDANQKKTFGYKRVEILAASLNAIFLIIICVFLFKEAYKRIQEPEDVDTNIVIVVATIGLVANVLAAILIRTDAHKSMNVKAAYVHLIGDSLSSFVVILGAIAIKLYQIYWIDPLITIGVGIYLIREAFLILRDAVNILMQSTPNHINIKKLQNNVESLEQVKNIHHVHIWRLSDNEIHLEAHVQIKKDLKLSEINPIQKEIEKILEQKFRIHHITLQFELNPNHSRNLISKRPE